jgi:hypothetical protein
MTMEVRMFGEAAKHGGSLLAVAAVVAFALSACSGNSATPVPSATPTAEATPTVAASTGPTGPAASGCDMAAAGTALADLDSYEFEMTLAGAAADTALQNLPLDQANSYTLRGTIVNSPAAGADITIGSFHVIEVGGYDYIDSDGNGSFTQVSTGSNPGSGDTAAASLGPEASPTSLVSAFTPQELYAGTLGESSSATYTDAGPETKNGIAAERCSADSAALEIFGSMLGISDAAWASEVWIAQDGGYPVAVSLTATNTDNTLAYELDLSLTKVNDPSNQVVAPTNIAGA